MDEFVRVFGTNFRFGLDPLLGLIPGIGDTSSALVSVFALIQALRFGAKSLDSFAQGYRTARTAIHALYCRYLR